MISNEIICLQPSLHRYQTGKWKTKAGSERVAWHRETDEPHSVFGCADVQSYEIGRKHLLTFLWGEKQNTCSVPRQENMSTIIKKRDNVTFLVRISYDEKILANHYKM